MILAECEETKRGEKSRFLNPIEDRLTHEIDFKLNIIINHNVMLFCMRIFLIQMLQNLCI